MRPFAQFAACMPIDEAEKIEPFAGYATPPAPARLDSR